MTISSKNNSVKAPQENSLNDTSLNKLLAGEIPSIDSSLKELLAEAKTLFKVLDSASNKIRELESCLKELKANFPFRYRILGESSHHKEAEERHIAIYPNASSYQIKIYWYLAWEQEDNSKSYRLCLICEENDLIFYGRDQKKEIFNKTLIKKPLIETDLPTRLQYSKHLLPFIDAFKNHIKSSRIAIELGEDLDELPF